jgi:hypothetical protein
VGRPDQPDQAVIDEHLLLRKNLLMNEHFSALLADLERHVGLDLQPDEDGAIRLQFDDGIMVQLCESEGDLFAVVADTGLDLATLPPEAQLEAATLFLQINFVTPLSSRIAIAQSPAQTIVITCSEHATRLTGAQLFDLVEVVLEKTRILKELIADFAGDGSSDASEAPAAHFVGRFA